jgi:hypothetical protein
MNVVTQIAAPEKSAAGRVADHDWDAIGAELNGYGCAVLPKLLTTGECRSIAALYPQEVHSAAISTWRATASARASTAISNIP